MSVSTTILRVYRLDSNTIRYVLTNPDGSAYDATGAKARLRIKQLKTDADGSSELIKTITTTLDPAEGQILAGGLLDFFVNHDDVPASGGSWSLETTEPPPYTYHLGAKLVTAATKYHTLHDGGLRWILEVMASDFTP